VLVCSDGQAASRLQQAAAVRACAAEQSVRRSRQLVLVLCPTLTALHAELLLRLVVRAAAPVHTLDADLISRHRAPALLRYLPSVAGLVDASLQIGARDLSGAELCALRGCRRLLRLKVAIDSDQEGWFRCIPFAVRLLACCPPQLDALEVGKLDPDHDHYAPEPMPLTAEIFTSLAGPERRLAPALRRIKISRGAAQLLASLDALGSIWGGRRAAAVLPALEVVEDDVPMRALAALGAMQTATKYGLSLAIAIECEPLVAAFEGGAGAGAGAAVLLSELAAAQGGRHAVALDNVTGTPAAAARFFEACACFGLLPFVHVRLFDAPHGAEAAQDDAPRVVLPSAAHAAVEVAGSCAAAAVDASAVRVAVHARAVRCDAVAWTDATPLLSRAANLESLQLDLPGAALHLPPGAAAPLRRALVHINAPTEWTATARTLRALREGVAAGLHELELYIFHWRPPTAEELECVVRLMAGAAQLRRLRLANWTVEHLSALISALPHQAALESLSLVSVKHGPPEAADALATTIATRQPRLHTVAVNGDCARDEALSSALARVLGGHRVQTVRIERIWQH
jgi:hypothetical protein